MWANYRCHRLFSQALSHLPQMRGFIRTELTELTYVYASLRNLAQLLTTIMLLPCTSTNYSGIIVRKGVWAVGVASFGYLLAPLS